MAPPQGSGYRGIGAADAGRPWLFSASSPVTICGQKARSTSRATRIGALDLRGGALSACTTLCSRRA
jgi:hypothetical protein